MLCVSVAILFDIRQLTLTDPNGEINAYNENYVWFFPSGVIAIRFMDEYDLDFNDLVKGIEKIRSSCQ